MAVGAVSVTTLTAVLCGRPLGIRMSGNRCGRNSRRHEHCLNIPVDMSHACCIVDGMSNHTTDTWNINLFDSIDINGDPTKLARTLDGYPIAWVDRNGNVETVDAEGNLHAAGHLTIDPAEFDAIHAEIAEFHGYDLP